MAIVTCGEIWNVRKGSETEVLHEYDRVFIVVTDNLLEGPQFVLALGTCLPAIGDSYVDADGSPDAISLCYKVDATQDQQDPWTWKVECHYSSDLSLIPLSMSVKKHWTTQKFQRVVYESLTLSADGTPLAVGNSAGEMFDPPPTRDENRMVLTLVRNELAYSGIGPWVGTTYDPAIASKYMDTLNDDTFFGFAAGLVKCESIVGEEITTGPVTYWVVTYVFHCRSGNVLGSTVDDWNYRPLDAGFREIYERADLTFGLTPILVNGHPVAQPYPLNGAGVALVIDFTKPILQQLTFWNFKIYPDNDFSVWGFPGA